MSACQRVSCVGAPAGVEAQAGDDHEGVAALRVDRDPLALAGLAPAHEAGGVERLVEHARRRGRRRTSSPSSRSPSPPTCRARRRTCRAWWRSVAGGDDRLDQRRRVGGRGREAVVADARPCRWRARPASAGRAARLDRGAQRAGVGAADAAVDPAARRGAPTSGRGAAVPRPNWPSTVVRKPARVRKSWRTRTSRPRIP